MQMPVDKLALRILEDFAATPQLTQGSVHSWMQSFVGGHLGGQPGDRPGQPVIGVVNTSIQWLFNEGLLATAFDKIHPQNSAIVTQRGRRVLAEGISGARAEARLNLDLHPVIDAKARGPYMQGDFDRAVFDSMKAVEIKVQDLSDHPSGKDNKPLYGVNLMRYVFGDQGPLRSKAKDPGERTGRMDLFAGAIALFKNPGSHREVEFADPTEVTETVLLADLLMRILDRIERDELQR